MAWSTICGSWFSTLPPTLVLPFAAQGASLGVIKVILLANELKLFCAAAFLLTKTLLVIVKKRQLLAKQSLLIPYQRLWSNKILEVLKKPDMFPPIQHPFSKKILF